MVAVKCLFCSISYFGTPDKSYKSPCTHESCAFGMILRAKMALEAMLVVRPFVAFSQTFTSALWSELADSLQTNSKWVATEVWNFAETRSDKSNNQGRILSSVEHMEFTQFLKTLALFDKILLSNTIRFSWNNRRQGESRTLARLDRIYAFKTLVNGTNGGEYYILGDSLHLDHLPIWRTIMLQASPRRKTT